jgi:hypothetical protein
MEKSDQLLILATLHQRKEPLWTLWRRKKSLVLLRIEPLFPVNSKGFDDGVKHWGLLVIWTLSIVQYSK